MDGFRQRTFHRCKMQAVHINFFLRHEIAVVQSERKITKYCLFRATTEINEAIHDAIKDTYGPFHMRSEKMIIFKMRILKVNYIPLKRRNINVACVLRGGSSTLWVTKTEKKLGPKLELNEKLVKRPLLIQCTETVILVDLKPCFHPSIITEVSDFFFRGFNWLKIYTGSV